MRGLEVLMFAGLIGLVGVAAWQGRSWFSGFAPHGAGTTAILPIAGKKDTGPSHKGTKSSAHARAGHRSGDASAPGLGSMESAQNSTAVDVPYSAIPNPDALAVGITRSELRQHYGDPALGVAGSRNGSLVERYYYFDSDRTRMIVATLHDGKLVSAQTVQR